MPDLGQQKQYEEGRPLPERGGPRNSDRLLRWIPTSEWRDRNHAETEKIPR